MRRGNRGAECPAGFAAQGGFLRGLAEMLKARAGRSLEVRDYEKGARARENSCALQSGLVQAEIVGEGEGEQGGMIDGGES